MCVYCLEEEIKRLESLKGQIEKTIDTLRRITTCTMIDRSKREASTPSSNTADNWSAKYTMPNNTMYGGITLVSKKTGQEDNDGSGSGENGSKLV